jgi:polysaccharide biosynthesis protein PelA
MQHIKLLILSLMIIATSYYTSAQNTTEKILFCYGDLFPKDAVGFDLVVLEPIHFSTDDITTFKNNNKIVLAYISLGEVNEGARHYTQLKDVTLGKNYIWNSYVLDISNAETKSVLLQLIERHLKLKGFDGIFIDNIDNYTKWGPTPEKLPALVSFLAEVKKQHPKSYILQNAGLLVLPETRPFIDAVTIESVATNYDFTSKTYKLRAKKDFKNILENIQRLKKEHDVPMILIEYATAKKQRTEIKKRIENKGIPYFIGAIELQTMPILHE